MMKIIAINGSSRSESSNAKLLDSMATLFPEKNICRYEGINDLPLFKAEKDCYPWTEAILKWRSVLVDADALIVCTPEYVHNIPALLKNALEWVTSSGELVQKPVLALTFTPHEPRGEKAMKSLVWTLKALDARVVAELPLYQKEITFAEGDMKMDKSILEILEEAVNLL